MYIFNKNLLLVLFGFVSFSPFLVSAATTPLYGSLINYGILSSTYTNTTAGTVINGSVGFTTPPAVVPLGTQPSYGSGAPYASAGTAQGALLSALNTQGCTYTFAPGAIDLSTDITHGTPGIFAPGAYCVIGAMNISGPLSLSGAGTYIFRSSGALTSTVGAVVSITGTSACDVFWTPTQATTLAANTTFVGTVVDDAGITIGANTTWNGMALSFGGTITTDTDTINAPSCTAPVVPVPPVVVPVVVPVIPPVNFSSGGSGNVVIIGPVIHIRKTATPTTLPYGGGLVRYEYIVTNPGTLPISNITLNDDKCSSVTFLSGDTNHDTVLDLTESWNFRCAISLSTTTTNLAVVRGNVNNLSASDFATATVMVATRNVVPQVLGVSTTTVAVTSYPTLPNAGLEPETGYEAMFSLWKRMLSFLGL